MKSEHVGEVLLGEPAGMTNSADVASEPRLQFTFHDVVDDPRLLLYGLQTYK